MGVSGQRHALSSTSSELDTVPGQAASSRDPCHSDRLVPPAVPGASLQPGWGGLQRETAKGIQPWYCGGPGFKYWARDWLF
jgi:hypothetical protein